jgi:hypothetical protein
MCRWFVALIAAQAGTVQARVCVVCASLAVAAVCELHVELQAVGVSGVLQAVLFSFG